MLESDYNDGTFNEEYYLGNAQMNPRKRTVQHCRECWNAKEKSHFAFTDHYQGLLNVGNL